MIPSLQFGKVRVGPFMLLFGFVPHLLLPGSLVFLAYGLDHWLSWSLDWPLWVRLLLGAVVLIPSVVLEGASLPHFFRAGGSPSPLQPTASLVVSGPYRYCRHPIYVAYVGYVLGPGIMLGFLSSPLVAAGFGLCLAIVAKLHEEPTLQRRFGEQYETYRRATPFMIPRPPSRRRQSPR